MFKLDQAVIHKFFHKQQFKTKHFCSQVPSFVTMKISATECFESYTEIRKIENLPKNQKGATIEIVEQILNNNGVVLTRQPSKHSKVCNNIDVQFVK